MNLMAAGPIVTTQIAGKMQNTSGNTIFTPVFAAASSARCRRFVRTRLGVHAQRLRDARAELVGLHQHRDERDDVVHAGALGEVVQRFDARLAGAQLEVDQPQLVGQIRVRERELLADALNRLIETEPRFDADHEQVERVGQPEPDAVLPPLGQPRRAPCPAARSRARSRRAPASGSASSKIGVAISAKSSERAAERGCRRR